jgi:hypothetical protein
MEGSKNFQCGSSVRPCGKRFDEDDFAVARGVEVGEEGFLNIAAGKIESSGRFVLVAGGGVRIDVHSPALRHQHLRHGHQLTADSSSLLPGVHGDPVEVETVNGSGDRAEAGVTDQPIFLFGEKEEIAARVTFGQPLLDELDGDTDFLFRKKPVARTSRPTACRSPGITSSRYVVEFAIILIGDSP